MSEKREKFLKEVMHEIDALKEHATPEEKEKLNFKRFNYFSSYTCIYGQLAGRCDSDRAKELMNKCCIRQMDLENGIGSIENVDIEDDNFTINGEYSGKTWTGGYFGNNNWRDYSYLSALEGYICTKGANNSGVIAYIKGETDSVIL